MIHLHETVKLTVALCVLCW